MGAQDPVVGRLVGDYLIVDKLGEGGFGKVYLALQRPLYRLAAALKLMELGQADAEMAGRMVRKFEGEATALAVLNHPNIVRLLKYGAHEGAPFLVMEFVTGGRTLLSEVEAHALRGEEMTGERVHRILLQVLDGLEAAHAQGVWHRDIKPENIMLQAVAGNADFVRILDFGLAKLADDGSRTSTAMGTPAYMAPEQMDRHGLGPWTDLYALGVIAFELITARRPFPGQSWKEILAQKLDPQYDPTSQLGGLNLPQTGLDFFRRALARRVEDRFRTTAAFRAGLEAFLGASAGSQYMAAGDRSMGGLVDSAELSRLRQERQHLEEENRRLRDADAQRRQTEGALAQERQRLDEERRQLEHQRRQVSAAISGETAAAAQPAPRPQQPAPRAQQSVPQQSAPVPAYRAPSSSGTHSAYVTAQTGGGGTPSRKPLIAAVIGFLVVAVGLVVVLVVTGGGDDEDSTESPANAAVDDEERTTPPDDPVEPDPAEDGDDYAAIMSDAEGRMNTAQWDEAIAMFSQVPVGHEQHAQADAAVHRARAERTRREDIYHPMLALAEEGRWGEALGLLEDIPERSHYAILARTEGLQQQWETAWVTASVSESQERLDVSDFEGARAILDAVQAAVPSSEPIVRQQAAISAAEAEHEREEEVREEREREEREAEAARARERERGAESQTAQEPTEMSSSERRERADELISQAQRLGLRRQHEEAIQLLNEAKDLRSRDHRIYMMLYRNYVGMGNNRRAADSLERYLELRPSDSNAEVYRQEIDRMRGE